MFHIFPRMLRFQESEKITSLGKSPKEAALVKDNSSLEKLPAWGSEAMGSRSY